MDEETRSRSRSPRALRQEILGLKAWGKRVHENAQRLRACKIEFTVQTSMTIQELAEMSKPLTFSGSVKFRDENAAEQ